MCHVLFQGYVVVKDFFHVKEELEPVKEDINIMVDELANKLYKAGKISSWYQVSTSVLVQNTCM